MKNLQMRLIEAVLIKHGEFNTTLAREYTKTNHQTISGWFNRYKHTSGNNFKYDTKAKTFKIVKPFEPKFLTNTGPVVALASHLLDCHKVCDGLEKTADPKKHGLIDVNQGG